MIFEWDVKKAKENLNKHHISFDEGKTVFQDPALLTFGDELHSDEEDRFISLGMSSLSKILLVVHTEVDSSIDEIVIRIISCRKATKKEVRVYEQQK